MVGVAESWEGKKTMGNETNDKRVPVTIPNAYLPGRPAGTTWNVHMDKDNKIDNIEPYRNIETLPGKPPVHSSVVVPCLCHPHVHLDKPYLLTCNRQEASLPQGFGNINVGRLPSYSDLVPTTGSFQEALSNTSKAKERYQL